MILSLPKQWFEKHLPDEDGCEISAGRAIPVEGGRLAKDMALWMYRGAMTYVQDIPLEDRKILLAHRLHSSGPHPLEQ